MPRSGENFGPYTLVGADRLGVGANGEVWLAVEDTGLSKTEFALKFMKGGAGGIDLDEVRREVDLWRKAGKHPNVISVIKAFIDRGEVIIVSEYADGGTLQKWLTDNGGKAPSLAWAMQMARGILAGLDHIQRLTAPILHRDLKPANILLDGPAKRPCLSDFGAATGLTTNHTDSVIGTFGYMPPEAFAGDKWPQSDIWAVGAIIYEMLAGRLPFVARFVGSFNQRAFAMQKAFLTPPPPLPPDVPSPVQAVIMKALTLNFTERYETAQAMLQALEEALTTPDRLRPAGAALPANAYDEFNFVTPTLDAAGKLSGTPRQLKARRYVEKIGGVELEMVEIPAGHFDRGSAENEAGSYSDEKPQRRVTVPAFFMGKGAVTQSQWRIVANATAHKMTLDLNPEPSHFKGDDMLPVDSVSWHDAQEFCARLSGLTGRHYRLPSEAEWEYACRAGTTTPFSFGETITADLVNYDSNYPYANAPKEPEKYRKKTWPVFSGKANPFGLCNLHGNLWEWCEDIWNNNYDGLAIDGSANVSVGDSTFRVLRGGSWGNDAWGCRSSYRVGLVPARVDWIYGFRVVAAAVR